MDKQQELDINFLDKYKEVERFLNDAYSDKYAVNLYLDEMNKVSIADRRRVSGWERDYNMLKRARYIRVGLAHEKKWGEGDTTQNDLEWIEEFYERLLTFDDPLACLRKYSQSSIERKEFTGKENVTKRENIKVLKLEDRKDKTFDGNKDKGEVILCVCLVVVMIVCICALLFL